MTVEQLRSLHQAQPYRPFRIHLADGRSLDVKHPEMLAHEGGRTVIVYVASERFEIVDLLLVSSLEIINGRTKQPRAKG